MTNIEIKDELNVIDNEIKKLKDKQLDYLTRLLYKKMENQKDLSDNNIKGLIVELYLETRLSIKFSEVKYDLLAEAKKFRCTKNLCETLFA